MPATTYQAVEPIPEDDALLFRPIDVPDREILQKRRLALGMLVTALLVGCAVGLASFHSKTRVHVKGLKGSSSSSSVTSLMSSQHQKHGAVKREYKLDGAKDGDDDTCETSDAITNYDSFKTQEECDSCCSEECSDYVSSDDAYLWMCESSYTSSTCSYTYDTYTIYKTPLCYACCETDCTRYISGEAHTVYFCS